MLELVSSRITGQVRAAGRTRHCGKRESRFWEHCRQLGSYANRLSVSLPAV